MLNKNNNKSVIVIAALFELILTTTVITAILSRQWKILYLSLLAAVCLILPFIITYISNIKNIMLPPSFNLVSLLFIFSAQYLGEIKRFYDIFWWWDIFLHSIFGMYAVIIALYIIQGIIKKKQGITKQRLILFNGVFSFSFSIALGTLWEMFEFTADCLFKTNMITGGFQDTATDLIAKILAAFITCAVYYHHSLRK
ncbi:hypothetical protein CPAST_c29870 [Clostridium pasteurianum DSM 525 = ATCC 6013]|uniref:Membrane-spanning protein n=1 Tax=Clostridium pasteurianum DSM 525 = ATCC 6013 TaxID=1262449 RepID=A0A0H3J9X3_CLOPA|nr:hypothetical protein [Clostridium pasteurianum]AJA49053.1 hypothetical protein CPAST_c29870 [Clostridium pasteurianum DSM 525 = ATCC 6013]AJA53041.1 hypothetical protein CLPA_c29870 [Clostridium pasteurianum DSM 525 = ATCC 6013]AOZ76257.1 hypothetical protein AQ983_14530 [Clostridium pasteurianum DSM 525 = ATCC 6013]AOZ80053.1 hypothetical protein AQ984_14525 [Clostridium pasteurianum]ELP58991.1 hypothetical protein F502_10896 [Clostridium pasteurianum DSM 525 = ATCC 6013]